MPETGTPNAESAEEEPNKDDPGTVVDGPNNGFDLPRRFC